MRTYVEPNAELIELRLEENIAFSGGEIIPDHPSIEIDLNDED